MISFGLNQLGGLPTSGLNVSLQPFAVSHESSAVVVGCVELQTEYVQPAHFVSRPMRDRGFVAFASAISDDARIVSAPRRAPANTTSIKTGVWSDDSHIVSKPKRGKR